MMAYVELNDLVNSSHFPVNYLGLHFYSFNPSVYFQVISKISGYLPLSDLKALRLLNSTWKLVTSSYRQKSRLQFHLSADQNGVDKLQSFYHNMAHLGDCLHLGIYIQNGNNPDLEPFYTLFDKVMRLLNPGIKSLVIKIDIWVKEGKMGQLIENILRQFSSELDTLDLTLNFDDAFMALGLCPGDNLTFPVLKTLKDHIYFRDKESVEELKPFYSKFLHKDSLPKVENLKISGNPNYFLWRVAQDPDLLPKLTTLEVSEDIGEQIGVLTNPDWTLTSLSLNICYYYGQASLTQLLDKMSPSLEHLNLTNVSEIIVIPSCPKLQTLSISFDLRIDCVEDTSQLWDPDCYPRLEFEENRNVSEYFPVLKVFTIQICNGYPEYLEDFGERTGWHADYILGYFPEKSVDVFRNLVTLKVPRDWAFVEEDIRAKLPSILEIVYNTEE